jgi:predicted RND superfamily exporter protein
VAAVCLVAMLAAGAGLPRIRTSIQMMRLFSQNAPVIPMTRWLEERLGATVPLEVVLRFGPESPTAPTDRLRLVAEIDARLRSLPQATGCLSAATFAPSELDSPASSAFRRSAINAKIRRRYAVLEEHGWLARQRDAEMWRISLRVRGIDDLDYAALVETLRAQVDPVLSADWPGVDLTITGTAPIVFQARRSLLDGLLFGLGTDVALIVIAVLLLTRNLASAAVMFVLSVFPTTLVFGTMGLLGIVVDIGSVMTPCVAVGVTVDDVIHFLLCYRRGVLAGMTGPKATQLAWQTCGRAMVQSWGIIGIGLSAFALSSFVPTFRFGMLMLLLVTAGLLGNLFFLPSLLSGPVGRWIANPPT